MGFLKEKRCKELWANWDMNIEGWPGTANTQSSTGTGQARRNVGSGRTGNTEKISIPLWGGGSLSGTPDPTGDRRGPFPSIYISKDSENVATYCKNRDNCKIYTNSGVGFAPLDMGPQRQFHGYYWGKNGSLHER